MTTDIEFAQEVQKHFIDVSTLVPGDGKSVSFIGYSPNGQNYYFDGHGNVALTQLLEGWRNNSAWKTKATFAEYFSVGSHFVLGAFTDLGNSVIDRSTLYEIRNGLDRLLAERFSQVTYYEACHIIPYYSTSFNIGPVHFVHFNDRDSCLKDGGDPFLAKENFIGLMQTEGVQWIAHVNLSGVLSGKGHEVAELAVDLALASIQLLFPPDQSHGMRRFTASNRPHTVIGLRNYEGRWSASHHNNSPGLSYTGPFFAQFIQQKSAIFDSYGTRILAFCQQSQEKLNSAWCDAAYWFHEGIAEPIDTIAVAKIETSLEVLMCAEDNSGSKSKILKALKIFSGKDDDDPISPGSEITIQGLSTRLVKDRSRILHGTLSTLNHDARFNRQVITQVTQILLTEVSVRLDEFKASPEYSDDHDQFLEWLLRIHKRAKSASP